MHTNAFTVPIPVNKYKNCISYLTHTFNVYFMSIFVSEQSKLRRNMQTVHRWLVKQQTHHHSAHTQAHAHTHTPYSATAEVVFVPVFRHFNSLVFEQSLPLLLSPSALFSSHTPLRHSKLSSLFAIHHDNCLHSALFLSEKTAANITSFLIGC